MTDFPHPRILFESVPDGPLLEELVRLAPVHGVFADDVTVIHPSDWDLVVSFHSSPETPKGVHVVSFGGAYFHSVNFGAFAQDVRRDQVLHARSVNVAAGVAAEVGSLANRTIVNNDPGSGRMGLNQKAGHTVTPLVVSGQEESIWAAVIANGEQYIWALPIETTNHFDWLVVVLKTLNSVDPVRFPGTADWRRARAWSTPAARSALQARADAEEDKSRLLAELDARIDLANEHLDAALGADPTDRSVVLTGSGEELVDAVQLILEDLGFDVKNMDDQHDLCSGGKLEDLRVTFDEGWTCLVEEKGYSKGAKVNDVGQIAGRPTAAYALAESKLPSALWHIVNSWRDRDPGIRPVAIPQEHDLKMLSESGGCLIDTRDLFLAWRDVQERVIDAATVAASLRAARVRWTWSTG